MAILELAFAKQSLRRLCESETTAEDGFGVAVAARLRRRLADLRAAIYANDVVAGAPRELQDGRRRVLTVELVGGYRIIFCANHVSTPKRECGGVDWSRVSRIKILRIESEHGEE